MGNRSKQGPKPKKKQSGEREITRNDLELVANHGRFMGSIETFRILFSYLGFLDLPEKTKEEVKEELEAWINAGLDNIKAEGARRDSFHSGALAILDQIREHVLGEQEKISGQEITEVDSNS